MTLTKDQKYFIFKEMQKNFEIVERLKERIDNCLEYTMEQRDLKKELQKILGVEK